MDDFYKGTEPHEADKVVNNAIDSLFSALGVSYIIIYEGQRGSVIGSNAPDIESTLKVLEETVQELKWRRKQ